jgi:hypothetical protein
MTSIFYLGGMDLLQSKDCQVGNVTYRVYGEIDYKYLYNGDGFLLKKYKVLAIWTGNPL